MSTGPQSPTKPLLLSALSALLITWAHGPETGPQSLLLPWICLLPFLKTLQNCTKAQGLGYSFTFGILSTLLPLAWISYFSLSGWILSSWLVIYPVLFALILIHFQWTQSPFKMASLWTLLETSKLLFPPFHHNPLAATLDPNPFWGITPFLGAESLTFLIVLINAWLASLQKTKPFSPTFLTPALFACCLIPTIWGSMHPPKNAPSLKLTIALIPSGTPNQKTLFGKEAWLQTLIQKTKTSAEKNPHLILWSEGTPFPILHHQESWNQLQALFPTFQGTLLATSPNYDKNQLFLSLITINHQTAIQEHRKTLLLPLAEKPFLHITPKNRTLFNEAPFPKNPLAIPIPSPKGVQTLRAGGLICAEEGFSPLTRRLSQNGAQIFLVSNNHEDIGPWGSRQMTRMAQLQAIQTQTPFVRCTNQGLSSWINTKGKIVWESRDQQPHQLSIPITQNHKPPLNTWLSPWFIISASLLCLLYKKKSTPKLS